VPATELPRVLRLTDVPFVAQPDWQCGPASLAMAMAAAGRPVPVDELADSVFVPGLKGSLQAEMLAAARRRGMLAVELPQDFDAIRRELAEGRPVIVLLNLGLPVLPRWHYAVVVGYDLGADQVVLHSGDTPNAAYTRTVFDNTWARGGRWALALTPPTRLPASPDDIAVARAASALQRVDPAASAQAWDALLQRWPESRVGRFGRANLQLARGDARAAAHGFSSAIAVDPGFADAWNNLALALDAMGLRADAKLAADRAIAIGGPRVAAYRETRGALERRP
jgi:tetratricopeptide (TPR) repeat protein